MVLPKKIYRAISYSRLSKDDYDRKEKRGQYKNESDSISNQRKLIREYVAEHDDIILVREEHDDGYTGTNFDRPGFRAVLNAIQAGEVDCVIVKDLSRLGREYIETGKYLEMVFPDKGIRFIAINDDVDSEHHSQSDDLLIPVKNLINETYCRELSRKLRSQFELQRRNGEFLGAFAAYGYRKSPDDKHTLVIDDYAAQVVRDIFALKMQGYSQQSIADALNKMGVLSPLEYKKQSGLNYKTGFRKAGKSLWSAMTVRRILTNTLYIGELAQGKRGTPNYKIKAMKERKQDDWVVVEHNHEPIVDELMFSVVQQILQRDTRTSPVGEAVQPFSGFVFCGECKKPMRRRTVTRNGKKFYYFTCERHVGERTGGTHNFSEKKLESAVLHAIQAHIRTVIEVDSLIQEVAQDNLLAVKLKQIDTMIEEKDRQIDRIEGLRVRLYEALSDKLIEREEYQLMRERYSAQLETANSERRELMDRRTQMEEGNTPHRAWVEQFTRYQNIQSISRDVIASLIDKIYILGGQHIHIDFNFRDEMADAYSLLEVIRKEAG